MITTARLYASHWFLETEVTGNNRPRNATLSTSEVLGRGAMEVVYKARQPGLNRIVALEMIGPDGHHCPTDLARFRREAVAVADLQHPNIIQI